MLRVLLIENDKKIRDIIKVGLDNFQEFEVDFAEDGWAVSMAEAKSYDLIIADLRLGDRVDGMALIKEIRQFDAESEVLLLSHGRSSRLLTKEKALTGIMGIIPLPIEEVSFYKTLSRVRDRIQRKRRPTTYGEDAQDVTGGQ